MKRWVTEVFAAAVVLAPIASAQTIDEVAVYAAGGKSVTTWHGQADIQSLNIEVGHALSPRTSVAAVIAPMNLWQPRSWFGYEFGEGNERVRALSASLLVRRTFFDGAIYAEAATGPMYAEKSVPASTSRFNFVTQFGAGTYLVRRSRFPLMVGYRYMHISNGGYSPRNPGLNVSAVVVGVRIRR
jgi:hypothetical protein